MGSVLPQLSRLRECLLRIRDTEWCCRGMAKRVGGTPVKIRVQWPVVIPGQRFFLSPFLAVRQCGLRHLFPWISREASVPRNTTLSKGSPLLQLPFPNPDRSQVVEFLCHWKKECFINLPQASESFSPNQLRDDVSATCSSASRNG